MSNFTVLSLFDGMSCGQIALNRAGVKYNTYYASEIEKTAISVTQNNYPSTIQLGDVTKLRQKNLQKIDLLMGGSPCQGFSFAGKHLDFNDNRSKLFFEYVRILDEIRSVNPDIKFLLENVNMKKVHLDTISTILGVDPIFINSSLVSAQNRPRWYWTNINFNIPKDKGLYLKDIVDVQYEKSLVLKGKGLNKLNSDRSRVVTDFYTKCPCILASQSKKPTDAVVFKIDDNTYRYPTRNEMEKLQTVPVGYTSCVSYRAAANMLGNGWTVDVIVDILKGLK